MDRPDALGATFGPDQAARFLVWAPTAKRVDLILARPHAEERPLEPRGHGYWGGEVGDLRPGTRYGYRLNRGPVRPDPASRSQPEGVHALSELVAPERFRWTDQDWTGRPAAELLFYELHVGTFGPRGTFADVVRRLDDLRALGVTALELLPIAQFPGARNWGYDGVYPFAVQDSYGGIAGLQRLSDASHARGLAVFVDVVPNHVGPEGNYLAEFGPYFTDRYRTPWGRALNFDGPGSDEVRRFFLESATGLVETAHLDGLRVDAVHAIVDPTAVPFLAELTREVHAIGQRTRWPRYLVAESALNDPRVVRPEAAGGWGFDAAWNDDFHHALHVALTGERTGYFADFDGPRDLVRVLVDGFALAGRYSASRGRRHGRRPVGVPADAFVVFAQNHDQVGNRPFGERSAARLPFEAQKLAAGVVLLSPYLPLLFMGEEYGETRPFLYFTSHTDPRMAQAVRRGRRAAFVGSSGRRAPPDPQARATFRASRLDPRAARRNPGRVLRELYRTLIGLRPALGPPRRLRPAEVGAATGAGEVVWIRRSDPASLAVFNFGREDLAAAVPAPRGPLALALASADPRWLGPGASAPPTLEPGSPLHLSLRPHSFLFYTAARPR